VGETTAKALAAQRLRRAPGAFYFLPMPFWTNVVRWMVQRPRRLGEAAGEQEGWTVIDRELNYGRHLILRFLKVVHPFATVVDLGAGRGDDLELARAVDPAANLHGIEACADYGKELRSRGFTVHRLNIERDSLPFPEEFVDVVIMNQILEHSKEVFWIFHEVSRILRCGGHAIIGVPNLASLHNRILLVFGQQPTSIQTCSAHVRGFTKGDLLRFLRTCWPEGYALRLRGGSNFYPFPPSIVKRLATIFPSLAWGMFLLLQKRRPYIDAFIRHPAEQQFETNFYLGPGASRNSARGVLE
jgi:SAM-dependent methyltransferase